MPTDDPRAAFIDAALWHGPIEKAEAILAAHPEIAAADIHTAAILGDAAAVRRFLALDPANATAKGEPRGWDALTHLCFSKYLRLDRSRSDGFVAAATALLDSGADPNTGFYDDNHQPNATLESALYGAAGVAHHPELTRLLLDRGADPNDGEVAYHSPETLDNRTIQVLVESGKLTPESLELMVIRKLDWHDHEGVAYLLDHDADTNRVSRWGAGFLHHALQRGNGIATFELLLDHGADPMLLTKDGATAFATAARKARADVLDLFERRGFSAPLQPDDAFLAACAHVDSATAHRLAVNDPTLIARLQAQNPGLFVDFASSGNVDSVRLMLDLGFDVASARTAPPWSAGETALHAAVWRGYLPMVNLLIERGAPLEAAHQRSGATPLAAALRTLIEQSEWTPNEFSIPIAQALVRAGAHLKPEWMTLAAALCLDRTEDAARLARKSTAADRHVALEAAAINGKVEAIAALLQLGVDVNAYNQHVQYHATPLHNAASSGSLAAVEMLVEAGAKVDQKDTAYQATARAWAEYFLRENKNKKQYAEIIAYLRAREQPTP